MVANIFTGATDSNWGTATNWSQAAVPTAADTFTTTFNIASPNCTVNTSARVCQILDFTGYTNTITFSQNLTVSGNVNLISGLKVSGAGVLAVNATSTFTSGGFIWPNALSFITGGTTITLGDNVIVSGLLTLGINAATITFNSNTLQANGSVTYAGGTSAIIAGSSIFVFGGTGTFTCTGTGGWQLSTTINTSGTLTLSGSTFEYNTGTLTYTAGTIVNSGTKLSVTKANATIAVNGMTWPTITYSGAFTITQSNDSTCSGLLTIGAGSTTTTVNGGNIFTSGGFANGVSSGTIQGTTVVNVIAGNISAPSFTTGRNTIPLIINAGSGTCNITSQFAQDIGKLTYKTGTVVPSGGSQWTTAPMFDGNSYIGGLS